MELNFKSLGSGKPLIILHGLFGSSDNWITIARRLESIRKVYLVDQRNHGDSPHSNTFSYDSMANDLNEFISTHQINDFELIGHSMGGKTAMFFASKFPEIVSKLIVVDISPKYYPTHHDKIIEGLKSIDLATIKSRNEADLTLAKYVPLIGVRQFLLKNLKRNTNGFEWKINLNAIEEQIEEVGKALPDLAIYNKPTLFIRGGLSSYILHEDEKIIEKHFPNSKLATIKSASHWVHTEQPEAFLDQITQFISS